MDLTGLEMAIIFNSFIISREFSTKLERVHIAIEEGCEVTKKPSSQVMGRPFEPNSIQFFDDLITIETSSRKKLDPFVLKRYCIWYGATIFCRFISVLHIIYMGQVECTANRCSRPNFYDISLS